MFCAIRETLDAGGTPTGTCYVTYSVDPDASPLSYSTQEFNTVEEAKAHYGMVHWQEPPADADGDMLTCGWDKALKTDAKPDDASFNAAVREAVRLRNQWLTPINIWMSVEGEFAPTSIAFDARAQTVPPGSPNDEHLMALDRNTLDELAELLDDQEAFDAYMTQLLADQIERGLYA